MSFDDETTFLCLVWTDYKRVGKPCVCKHPHPHTHTHTVAAQTTKAVLGRLMFLSSLGAQWPDV